MAYEINQVIYGVQWRGTVADDGEIKIERLDTGWRQSYSGFSASAGQSRDFIAAAFHNLRSGFCIGSANNYPGHARRI